VTWHIAIVFELLLDACVFLWVQSGISVLFER
jgi:hypothetical protein